MMKHAPQMRQGSKRHLGATPATKTKHRHAQPAELHSDVASALKVKNFRKLREAMGEEALAVVLDLTLPRIQEMGDGVNLSNEMAHHIETALGLESGFMDQVNPLLSEKDIERLQQLANQPRTEEAPATAAAPTPSVIPPSEVPPMPSSKKKDDVPTAITPPSESTPSATPSAAAPLTGEDALRQIRRDNLALLTQRPGTKTQLGRLTGLSAANVSHRLHGVKIFDKDTADFFCEKLGLPMGWFETQQTEATIPEVSMKLLLDKNSEPFPSSRIAKPVTGRPVGSGRKGPKPATGVIPTGLAPVHPVVRGALTLGQSALGRDIPGEAAPATTAVSVAAPTGASLSKLRLAEDSNDPAVPAIVDALLQTIELKAKSGKLSQQKALAILIDLST